MKIAPIDIAHKTFTRRMMGLDQDEVMDFLRQVAEEMETLVREKNSLRETLREKDLAIIEFRERDELLKSTITTATKMSDRIQQDSEREARLITGDAKQQAEMIVRDARDSLKKIFQDISELKKIRMQYENNLKALAQAQLSLLEQGHKMMPDPALEMQNHFTNINQHNANPTQREVDSIKSNVVEAVKNSIRNMDLDIR
jgi:cell division initiation protein